MPTLGPFFIPGTLPSPLPHPVSRVEGHTIAVGICTANNISISVFDALSNGGGLEAAVLLVGNGAH